MKQKTVYLVSITLTAISVFMCVSLEIVAGECVACYVSNSVDGYVKFCITIKKQRVLEASAFRVIDV